VRHWKVAHVRGVRRRILGGHRAVYRTMALSGRHPLKDAQVALDTAMLAACVFYAKADLLKQLLDLNHAVAAAERAGQSVTAPGVPASYGDPATLLTDDCIRPATDATPSPNPPVPLAPDEAEWSAKEDEYLIPCALRFDGWKYEQEAEFDHRHAYEQYTATGDLPDSREELLTMFFMAQRFLYKWGGEYLPRTDPHWRLFRSLFLRLYRLEIGPRYRLEGHLSDPWDRMSESERDAAAAMVRTIHERTQYDPPGTPP
jgi:hypothetical protein